VHAYEAAEDRAVSAPRQRQLTPPPQPGRQAAIILLQQAAGNAAVSRLLTDDSGRSSNSPAKIAQRQDASDDDSAEAVDGATPAMGAPPIIAEDLEFSADSDDGEDAAVQMLVDPVVQRQTGRPMGQPPFRPPAGCPVVTLANFPRRNPGGQFAANTAFAWSLRKRHFTVTFNRAGSWVRPSAASNQQLERHEQYHLRLACAIATIANDMLARGDDEKTVTAQLRNSLRIHTQQYDAATNHGTIAQQQTAFEQAIDAGQVQMAGP
jgi:hypothetical protein